MAAPEFDLGLLQPTLTEVDDVTGYKKPWNPHVIPVIGFLFGPVAAGVLFGFNYPRLGEPRKQWPTLVGFVLLSLVYWVVALYGLAARWWPSLDGDDLATIHRVVTILASLAIARQQRSRYRLAQFADCELGSLWIPGLIASVIGLAAQYYMPEVALQIIRPFFV